VVVEETFIAVVNCVEAVVGSLPSKVYLIVAPSVSQLISLFFIGLGLVVFSIAIVKNNKTESTVSPMPKRISKSSPINDYSSL
jgi:hypothetical protein